jgi:hypothetical protein
LLWRETGMIYKKHKIIFFITAAVISLVIISCLGCSTTGGSTPTPSSSTTTPPSSGISFGKDVQPIFNSNCAICHQGSTPPGGLDLETGLVYNNLVNVKSTESPLMRVAPGSPDKSYIINKLQGTQSQAGGSGAQMPFGGSPLSQTQINLIQQWISQGALNN